MAKATFGFTDIPGGAHGSDMLVSYGPTLPVDIGFDPGYDPEDPSIPVPGVTGISALVDTGASQSCIDSLLAAQLGLPVVDKIKIAGAGGGQVVNMHLAQVFIPSLNWLVYGLFAGVHLAAGGQSHKALIGRTFLQNFTMTYEGKTGRVTISSD
jgi:predicted aspartyl protease